MFIESSKISQLIFSLDESDTTAKEIEKLYEEFNLTASVEDLLLILQFLYKFGGDDKNIDIILNSGVILTKLSNLIAKHPDDDIRQKSYSLLASLTKCNEIRQEHNEIEVLFLISMVYFKNPDKRILFFSF
jgi:hypothetical protein